MSSRLSHHLPHFSSANATTFDIHSDQRLCAIGDAENGINILKWARDHTQDLSASIELFSKIFRIPNVFPVDLKFSPNGEALATIDENRALLWWKDKKKNNWIAKGNLRFPNRVVKCAFDSSSSSFYVGDVNGYLYIMSWKNVLSGSISATCRAHKRPICQIQCIEDVDFSDGNILPFHAVFTLCEGGNVSLTIQNPSSTTKPWIVKQKLVDTNGACSSISVHRVPGKGTFIACACTRNVQIWHTASLLHSKWTRTGSFSSVSGISDVMRDAVWHSRGDALICSSPTSIFFVQRMTLDDAKQEEEEDDDDDEEDVEREKVGESVWKIVHRWSANAQDGGAKSVKVIKTGTLRMVGPNAVLFLSGNGDPRILRWGPFDKFGTTPYSRTLCCAMTLHSLELAITEESDKRQACSASPPLIASGCTDGSIALWIASDRWRNRLFHHCHSSCVTSLCFTQHKELISGSQDGTIAIWNVIKNSQYDDVESAPVLPPEITLAESFSAAHNASVSFVCCSPNGLHFASFGSEDSSVKVWERIRSGMWEQVQILDVLDEGIPECGAFDLSSSQLTCGCQDGRIILWKCEHEDWTSGLLGQWTQEAILLGHESTVSCITFYNRNTLLSGSEDGTVGIWNLQDGSCTHTFECYRSLGSPLTIECDRCPVIADGDDFEEEPSFPSCFTVHGLRFSRHYEVH